MAMKTDILQQYVSARKALLQENVARLAHASKLNP